MAPRHVRLWDWSDLLEPAGEPPPPRVEVWPRGGGKSSTAELAVVRVGAKLSRRFVLYVCETQDQANLHVQAISTLFETMGVDRAVNQYGASKGWKVNLLRTKSGFNVLALGLDAASRGVKLDQFRPDLIIFDDIDNQDDSSKTVKKKIRTVSTAILPAGAWNVAVLFLQNLIHEEGIVAQLVDGRADFIRDREVPEIDVAVVGLEWELVQLDDGRSVYKITGGKPTWEGQNLQVCEWQINKLGLAAFLREMQQEVRGADGVFFNVEMLRYCEADEVPDELALCRAWDLAATEGGGDWTVGVLLGIARNGVMYVLDVIRVQYGSDKVRSLVLRTAKEDQERYGRVKIHVPQDPAQAGKDQAVQYKKMLAEFVVKIEPVTGSKGVRARGWQAKMNSRNVVVVKEKWNYDWREEHRKFVDNEPDQVDDQVDASADSHTELDTGREPVTSQPVRTGLPERETSGPPGASPTNPGIVFGEDGLILPPRPGQRRR